jgi:hypothetical protein
MKQTFVLLAVALWLSGSPLAAVQRRAVPSDQELREAVAIVQAYLDRHASDGSPRSGGLRELSSSRGDALRIGQRAVPAPDVTGLTASPGSTTGLVVGVRGVSGSTGSGSAGVLGEASIASGDVFGVVGRASSAAGSAALFDNTAGGDILRGSNGVAQVFEVSGSGQVTAAGFSGDGSNLTGVDAATLDSLDSTALLQKAEVDTEAELESLLTDVTNVLTDDETAATATALAADGTNCGSAEFARGVDDEGNAQACDDQTALHSFGTSNRNTRTGEALSMTTTGLNNTGVGYGALSRLTDEGSNTAVGVFALEGAAFDATGSGNTAIGVQAARQNYGDNNVAVGREALFLNSYGDGNTAVGYRALFDAGPNGYSTYRNTAIGYLAGSQVYNGSDNIHIGSGATGGSGDSNTIRIGGTTVGNGAGEQNRTFINGIRGISVANSAAVLIDTNTGQLGSMVSSTLQGGDPRHGEDLAADPRAAPRHVSLPGAGGHGVNDAVRPDRRGSGRGHAGAGGLRRGGQTRDGEVPPLELPAPQRGPGSASSTPGPGLAPRFARARRDGVHGLAISLGLIVGGEGEPAGERSSVCL